MSIISAIMANAMGGGSGGGPSAVEIVVSDYGIHVVGAEGEVVFPDEAAALARQALAERKTIMLVDKTEDMGSILEYRLRLDPLGIDPATNSMYTGLAYGGVGYFTGMMMIISADVVVVLSQQISIPAAIAE